MNHRPIFFRPGQKTRRGPLYSLIALLSAASMFATGCGSSSTSTRVTPTPVVTQADPFTVLDQEVKAGSIDPHLISERVDAARQEWLRAEVAQEKSQKTEVVKHFENAIEILNHLINYPGVDSNKDFQEVSRSIFTSYEKYVAKIDSLPPNASVFAFRAKFNQEMAKMDIKNVPMPRIDLSATTIPLTMNTAVEQTIAYFSQGNGRPYMQKWLGRTGRYFPMMKKIMKEEGVPEEMVHLAMIESGLNPSAVSWAKAVGMWQFIDATGARYGLDNNWWYDKRRDPVAATRAAARHLHDLHSWLGDWHLALAAYNSGINRVKTAMSQAGSRNFWEIRPFLPKETQNYVPLYIAATLIELDPARYGFNDINYETPVKVDTVHVRDAIDLNALAKAAGVTELELKDLNPDLLQPSTPPLELCGPDGYCLRLPAGTSSNFYDRLAAIPASERKPWMVHTVGRGETINSIAHLYGVSTGQLAEYNNMSETERVRRGQRLRVPMAVMGPQTGAPSTPSATPSATPGSNSVAPSLNGNASDGKMRMIKHKVKRGETLNSVAREYSVSVQDLKEWNNLSGRQGLKRGRSLTIYRNGTTSTMAASTAVVAKHSIKNQPIAQAAPQRAAKHWVTYKVRRGDTMGKIADDFNVNLADLRSWNRRTTRHGARAGQQLKVFAAVDQNYAESDNSDNSSPAATHSGAPKFHTVLSGETMTGIARTFGVSVADLSGWNNNLDASSLRAGERLKIYADNITPAKGDRMSARSTKASRHQSLSYRVKRGDTLYSIATKYDVTVSDLKHENHLRSTTLTAGKRLHIPND